MKKLFIISLVIIIIFASSISVYAASYCPVCNTYTVDEYCSNNPCSESGSTHTWVDPETGIGYLCSYIKIYYRTFYECSTCQDSYYSGFHLHSEIRHDYDTSLNGVCCTLTPY